MSNTSEEYKGTSSEEDSRAEGATVANFVEDHCDFELLGNGNDDNHPVILLNLNVDVSDVILGVTAREAHALPLFKSDDVDNDEARAAMRAFEDLIGTVDEFKETIEGKIRAFEKPMRAWVEKTRTKYGKWPPEEGRAPEQKKKRKTCK